MNATDQTDIFSVRGKNALITGGSRGIGLMIAKGLLEAGANVIISARKAEACEAAAAELSAFGSCKAIPADVSSAAGATALAEGVKAEFDKLHILVNNAGSTWGAPIAEYPEEAWDKVLNTNVRGVFFLTQQLLDPLRAAASKTDPARVINIGSVDGIRAPMMETYAYSASKAALHQLTRHLGKRLAAEAITVNAIAPGPFASKMTAFMLDNPDGRAAVEQTIPLGRIGGPNDVAGTVQFLSSSAGSYVTGVVIPLDGGYTGCS